MKLTIHGDLNEYYLQTLCMLFYPGAKFSEKEDSHDTAEFIRIDHENTVEVICRLTSGEKSAQDRYEETVGGASMYISMEADSDPRVRASKYAAGIAAIGAGKLLFGVEPAWGLLTGIRPAKLTASLLDRYPTAEVRSILTESFHVTPRKATLVMDIARNGSRLAKYAIPRETTCSLYISIPFCPSRCAYCSFVSYTTERLLSLIPDYVKRLTEDLQKTLAYIKSHGWRLTTIYIGGGTPTTLSESQLELILDTVYRNCNMDTLAEFTLEAGRPDTVTKNKLEIARSLGVTRVSINPQTMNDTILRAIGRRHTVADFYRAYTMAKNSGIKIINTDLIAGLPGDDFRNFSGSIDRILSLNPENVTVHTFCVKKSAELLKIDTEIYNHSAEETIKAVDYSQISLKNAGYSPYYIYRQKNTVGNLENVGFAKHGTEGIYNVLMMEELHTIFAVGAGAVTKLVKWDINGKKFIERLFEPKYPYEYLDGTSDETMAKKIAEMDSFFNE